MSGSAQWLKGLNYNIYPKRINRGGVGLQDELQFPAEVVHFRFHRIIYLIAEL